MPIYYSVGTALVTEAELQEKIRLGNFDAFDKDLTRRIGAAAIEFSTGRLTADNRVSSIRAGTKEPINFEDLDIGKPLVVEIRRIYTGEFPEVGALGRSRRRDMLVTSAMKNIATFEAAPRAVNYITKNVRRQSTISLIAATDKGTPLIYYTPALTEPNSIVTIELGFDEFDDTTLGLLSNAFSSAAGLPVFAAARFYLMAATTVMRIGANLGNLLFDRQPVFKATESIAFLRGGARRANAGFALLTSDEMDPAVLRDYHPNEMGELVDRGGREYRGSQPYCMISLDGRRMDSYRDFSATAASAELLGRFYKIKEGEGQALGPLADALKLYNDWKFRKRADSLKQELSILDQGTEAYTRKKIEYDAAVANILDELLRPVVGTS